LATVDIILGKKREKRVVYAGLKSVFWTFFCVFFGLLQLLAIYVIAKTRNDVFDLDKILRDGVILFFCSAFIFTSVIDYFSTDYKHSKQAEWFFLFFVFIPVIMVLFILILYTNLLGSAEHVDMNFLRQGTILCFIITVIHAIIFRAIRIHYKGGGD